MPSKPAIVGSGPVITYDSLIAHITQAAGYLAGLTGRVLVVGENSPRWIMAFYAVLTQGLVAVPVDAQASPTDIRYIVDDCTPVAVFCSAERRISLDVALAGLPNPPRILVFEELELSSPAIAARGFDFNPDPAATAVIIYTSGTTGSPKGVMLSYANLRANMDAVCAPDVRVYRQTDTVMMLLPIHHIFPLLGTLMLPLYVGATIALCPAMTGEVIIRTLKEHRVSIIIGVPRLYSMIRSGIRSKIDASPLIARLFALAGSLKSRGFSKLLFGSVHRKFGGAVRVMVSGGAALDPEVAQDFLALGFEMVEGYGMTETAPMITFTRPGTLRPGSPGQALPGIDVEIRDEEIVVRGPNVMQGYYNRPQETAEILKDGWLHTGDLGEFDADGFLRITGRRKEIIVLSNGKNINPAEIEARLEAMHAGVKEAAVYQDGDRLRVLIVPDRPLLDGQGVVDINAWVRESIIKNYNKDAASYKVLAGFSFSDNELPRTRLGKLRRFQLAALAQTGGLETRGEPVPVKEPNLVEFKIIADYLEREKKLPVHATDHLILDIGLDSLDSIGLQTFLEGTFGFRISLEELAAFENVGNLAHHVAASKTHFSLDGADWAHVLRETISRTIPKFWSITPLVKALSNWFFRFYFRFSARGLENIPNEPCIIAPNHQSFFDAFFIVSVLTFRKLRNTFFFAKSRHIQGHFLEKLARQNNIIVMDLNRNLKESIMRVAEVLKSRRSMLIFPEGTRTKDGKLGDFKKMFAILARELNVPIVPVAIQGAWEALPRGSRFPLPFKPIRLSFMPAVYPAELDYDSLTELVRSAIAGSLAVDKD